MPIKRKDRQAVFDNRDCRTVFSTYPNSQLRKRKQILKVVGENYLTIYFSYSAEFLADIIQSLLLNGDFPYRPSPPAMPAGSKARPDTAALPVASPFLLADAIKSFHLNDQFSDLTAVSHGMRYPLHRVLVCPQSDVLAKACDFNQHQGEEHSQAQTATFTFDDEIDDQLSVSTLIYYFYNQDYSPDDMQVHPGEGNDNSMLMNEILAHVCIFRLAEKYRIEDLQLLARKKFMAAATSSPKVEHLLEAVREVYSDRFPSHDTSIRGAILDVFWDKQDLLDRDDVKQMLRELADLSTDLLLGFREKKKGSFINF